MKVFVASICALLVGSSTAVAQDISAKDFDLACAVTASAVVASSPKGAVERDSCHVAMVVLPRSPQWSARQDVLGNGDQGAGSPELRENPKD